MSVRYYISKILPPEPVQSLDPNVEFRDYYRPPIKDLIPTVAHVNRIPVFKSDGKPIFDWTLVYVSTTNWAPVDGDLRNVRLFLGEEGDSLSHKAMMDNLALKRLSDVPRPKRAAIRNFLSSKGVQLNGAESFREVLQKVRRHLDLADDAGELREYVA